MTNNKEKEILNSAVEDNTDLNVVSEEVEHKEFKIFRCSRCGEEVYTESTFVHKCPHCHMIRLKFVGESNSPLEEDY